MRKKFRIRMDDNGLSLVELLIAVVILAVIVAPLLHAFVTAARVNAISKKELRETALAQDIMEGLKAYSVEDLAYQFNYPTGGVSEYSLSFNVVSPKLIDGGIASISSHVTELTDSSGTFSDSDDVNKSISNYTIADRTDPNKEHVFKKQPSGKYYYAIKDMALADVSVAGNDYMKNSFVDVLIVADANEFSGPSVSANKPNSKELIDIPMMNSYIDAFYVEDSYTTTNNVAAQYFKNKYHASDSSVTVDDIVKRMKKTITIESKKTPGAAKDGKDRYEINVTTEYKLRKISGASFEPLTFKTNSVAFDNISTGEILQNVYLFYQPVYHDASDYSQLMDEITYKATTGVDINWYIVKQGSLSVYAADEQNYDCEVKVIGDESTVKSIRTNLDFNMVTNIPITPGNTNYAPAAIKSRVKELFGEETQDRLYECTVYLFEKGTINKWVGGIAYDLDTCLTKIEGNMK